MENPKNIACRIFKEQIELILALPEQDRAEVLYSAIINAFNQFENQNENQIENACISRYKYNNILNNNNISSIGKRVFNLLEKNIVFKEYNSNYGGKRINSGRKKEETPSITTNTTIPTLDEVLNYAKEMNSMAGIGGFICSEKVAEQFWSYYQAQNWRIGNEFSTPIKDWKAKLRNWATNNKNIDPEEKEWKL